MTQKLRALLLDDTPTMRLIVSGMLEELGYADVELAESAEQAWEFLTSQKFDLAIFDWNLPGKSGVDLLRQVRSRPTLVHLPVVMITSNNDSGHISEARAAGVSNYLVKPFSIEDLKLGIQEAERTHKNNAPKPE